MSEKTLIVEYWVRPGKVPGDDGRVVLAKHPACWHAVHDRTLTAIHRSEGEIGGYADGVWLRFWYDPETLS